MAHDVFISYASEDKLTADAVCAKLEGRGIRCWIAPRDIMPGETWPAAVSKAIDGSRVMVLVFSQYANFSHQIPNEVTRAVSNGLVLVPLRIEDVLPARDLSLFLGMPHWLDAITPPLEQHLDELGRAVESFLADSPSDPDRLKIDTDKDTHRSDNQKADGDRSHESGDRSFLPTSQASVTLSETQHRALRQWVRLGPLFSESLDITGRAIMAPAQSDITAIAYVGNVLAALGVAVIALYSWAILIAVFVWLFVQAQFHKSEVAKGTALRVTGTFGVRIVRRKDSTIRGGRLALEMGSIHLNAQQATLLAGSTDADATGRQVFAGTLVFVKMLGPNHLIAASDRSGRLVCGDA